MSEFLEVGNVSEFDEGEMRQLAVDGHELLVARVGGEYYVSDARCPHLHAHLAKGTLEGTVLTCPLHHSRFDLTDGRCVQWTDFSGPIKTMAEFARHPRPLRVYETTVTDGVLFVGPEKPPVSSDQA
ncbi:MAG: Rieske 2Fe-2S domain-containing protein [Coriobacteriia bacterium]|nr:Rieske 2Fe-2S domain-containing protein [Coriobacteriia bacterium]